MAKRFIVLIDFSGHSAHLLGYASCWRERADAGLLLLHQNLVSFPSLIDYGIKKDIIKKSNHEALQRLKAFAADLIPQDGDVSFLVDEKPLPHIMSDLIKEPYNNLIFVGLKGTGILKKWFLGSVVVEVIETVPDIVVAIPKDAKAACPEMLFIGVREEHPLNIPALGKLLGYSGQTLPAMHFFTVARPGDDLKRLEAHLTALSGQFSEVTKTTFSVYQTDNTIDFIKEMILSNPGALMVIQKGSRMLKDHFLRQFLTNELAYDGRLPLIILP